MVEIVYPFFMKTINEKEKATIYVKVTKTDIFYLEIKKTSNGKVKKVKIETRMKEIKPVLHKTVFSFAYRNTVFYSDTDMIMESEFIDALIDIEIFKTDCVNCNKLPFYKSRSIVNEN